MNVITLNKALQDEAKIVLQQTKLLDYLEKIGNIELGGSYVYGTMVDRDIDIAVIVDENIININFRKMIMDELLNITNLDGIAMTDRYHHHKTTSPKGIWFGPIVWYKGSRWNIDIWFVTQDEPYSHHNQELHKRMLQITDEQKNTILKIKYDALQAGTKEKGVTSSEIYKAVLDNNISSYDEFIDNNKLNIAGT